MGRALSARGWRVIRCPAFALEAGPAAERRAELARRLDCDLAIVTSPFAAELVVADAPCSGAAPIFVTPGPGTASVLEASGRRVLHPAGGGTSEDVLSMPLLRDVTGRRIVIVGAPGGRRLLDRELSARGASVGRIDLYRRVPLPVADELIAALADGLPLIVAITSRNAFETIMQALPEGLSAAWLAATFVVSSPRLATVCREAGARSVHEAGAASDAAVLEALDRLV